MIRPKKNEFLDYELTTKDKAFLDFADALASKIGISGYLIDEKKRFLITLLQNLKLNYDSNIYVNVPMRKEYYSNIPEKYRISMHSFEITKQIVDGLYDNGFLIIEKGSNTEKIIVIKKDKPKLKNLTTSCKASPKLFGLLKSFPKTIITRDMPTSFVVLRNLDEDDEYEDVDYNDPYADTLNEEIKEYASLREKSNLSLNNIPPDIFKLCRSEVNRLAIENTNILQPDVNGNYSFTLLPTYTVRIFNNDFNHGGRFYRGAEFELRQRYKKLKLKIKLRQYIAINGRPTIELDFNAMHPRMLYHKEGIDYRNDPYVIGRNCDENYRSIYKKVGMICINSESEQKAIDAIQDKLQEEGLTEFLPDNSDETRRKLINAFKRHNRPIEKYFLTGIGSELQKIDSDIAHSILMYFARKGILVLCIHDSFIIDRRYRIELKRKMSEFYEAKMRFMPKIK